MRDIFLSLSLSLSVSVWLYCVFTVIFNAFTDFNCLIFLFDMKNMPVQTPIEYELPEKKKQLDSLNAKLAACA